MAQPSKKEVMQDPILKKGHAHKPRMEEPYPCPECGGKGYILTLDRDEDCPFCFGTGEIWE